MASHQTLSRRLSALSCSLLVTVAMLAPSHTATGQQLSSIAPLMQKLADILAGAPGIAARDYLYATFGAKAYGGLAKGAVVDAVNKVTSDGQVKNLAGHLKQIKDASQLARREVEAINARIGPTPNDAAPVYCDKAKASQDQIDRIQVAVGHLKQLQDMSESYLRAMPPIEQMLSVLRDYWNKAYPLAQTADAVNERTTFGTIVQQHEYWTAAASECSEGDPCAMYLAVKARENWQSAAKQAQSKRTDLNEVLDARKAYHSHFFATSSGKCQVASSTDNRSVADTSQLERDLGIAGEGKSSEAGDVDALAKDLGLPSGTAGASGEGLDALARDLGVSAQASAPSAGDGTADAGGAKDALKAWQVEQGEKAEQARRQREQAEAKRREQERIAEEASLEAEQREQARRAQQRRVEAAREQEESAWVSGALLFGQELARALAQQRYGTASPRVMPFPSGPAGTANSSAGGGGGGACPMREIESAVSQCTQSAQRAASMCGTYQAVAQCMNRIESRFRACPDAVALSANYRRQGLRGGAGVCTNCKDTQSCARLWGVSPN